MITKRKDIEKFRKQGLKVAIRRAIQDEYLVKLASTGFKFGPDEKE